MTRRRPTRGLLFGALVALQLLAVLAGVAQGERVLRDGVQVRLASEPVDPRDPLRGDYVVLRYRAEDVADVGGVPSFPGARVYVRLRDEGRYWEAVRVESTRRPPTETEVWLRTRVQAVDDLDRPTRVAFDDLGRYYVPEGRGVLAGPPDVLVRVTGDGARIERLELDGRPVP